MPLHHIIDELNVTRNGSVVSSKMFHVKQIKQMTTVLANVISDLAGNIID